MIWVRSYSMCANERQTNTAFESSAACFQGHLSKDDTHPPPVALSLALGLGRRSDVGGEYLGNIV